MNAYRLIFLLFILSCSSTDYDQLKRARELVYDGQYVQAIDQYNNLMNTDLEDSIYQMRGIAYLATEEYRKALNDFETALSLEPTNERSIFMNIGSSYIALNKCDSALLYYSKAEKIKDDPNIYMAISQSYFCLKEYEMSLTYVNKELEERERPFSYKHRAYCNFNLERFKETIDDLNRTISFTPNDAEALNLRGRSLHKLNSTDSACLDFIKAAELGYSEAEKNLINFCNTAL